LAWLPKHDGESLHKLFRRVPARCPSTLEAIFEEATVIFSEPSGAEALNKNREYANTNSSGTAKASAQTNSSPDQLPESSELPLSRCAEIATAVRT
jgi:hypothetical protein